MPRVRAQSKFNPASVGQKSKFATLVPLLLNWFAQNARDLPWRRTRDPYAIWVSEIMLQQTQVKTVLPYWERWMRELPTIESLAKASSEKIHKLWEGLGYYTRVRNMQKAAQQIVADCSRSGEGELPKSRRGRARHSVRADVIQPMSDSPQKWRAISSDGTAVVSNQRRARSDAPYRCAQRGFVQQAREKSQINFPDNFDDVLALPGIGRYTAGAICSIAFNQPTPILDGNVIRVLTRVFGIRDNPREKETNAKLWSLAEQLVTRASNRQAVQRGGSNRQFPACSHLNQSLMELGALICTPRDAKCESCPISRDCFAFRKNRIKEFPNLEKRPAAIARRFAAFVVENRGKFLVRQRPAGVVNAHLWEFPNVELNGAPTQPKDAAREALGFTPSNVNPLCTIKHTITRYRITVEAFRVGAPVSDPARRTSIASDAPGRRPAFRCRWLPPSELHKLSFSSAHKKILESLHMMHAQT